MSLATFASAGFFSVGGAPGVDLDIALYALHTTYWDPIKKSDQPAPLHMWALYSADDQTIVAVSGPSDDGGNVTIARPKALADGDYALGFYPIPSSDGCKAYVANREAWLDLEKNAWVDPPPPTAPRLEARKLLRIPAWTTIGKATFYGGGFKEIPSKSPDFAKTGRVRSSEVDPYGTVAKPWEIALDHGWMRTKVRYLFINWKDGKEETLPPGLVVEARTDEGIKLGAGTAIDDADGTAYVLVAGTKECFKTLQVGFSTPPKTRVDLSAAAASPDKRLTCDGDLPADRSTRNTLPSEWHSFGMMGWADGAGASTGKWARWTEQRKDLASSATEPLITFHLDDVVLWNKADKNFAKLDADTRITFFDHLLAIRDPDAKMTHLSTTKLGSAYIAARTLFTVSPSPAPSAPTTVRDLSTRLIGIEGTFYDLEEKRVVGTAGKNACLGARAAVSGDHPIANYTEGCAYLDGQGHHELHFVGVPSVKDPSTKMDLSHLFVYVGSKIEGESDVSAAAGTAFYKNLTYASVRWSQGHPGVVQPGASSPAKDYRIVPVDASKRGKAIMRLRFFYGTRTDGKHKFTIKLTVDDSPKKNKRSFVSGGTMTYYDSAIVNDATNTSHPAQDADSAPAYWQTLAHEFGHVCGLPDEYYETLDPKVIDPADTLKTFAPVLAQYDQYSGWKSGARPYWQDAEAMMRGNKLLRLRHVWHHAHAFGVDPAFSGVAGQAYLARNEAYPGGGLDFVTPDGDAHNPYFPVPAATRSMTGQRADLTVFPVGEDEGLVEKMFGVRATGQRFDALLVVSIRFRFVFDSSIIRKDQWGAMNQFQAAFYDPFYAEHVRYQLVGASRYKRIAVLLHPSYAYGPMPGGVLHLFDKPDTSHFVLDVRSTSAVAAKDNPFTGNNVPAQFTLGTPDLSAPWPLVRLALYMPMYKLAPDGKTRLPAVDPIGAFDMQRLAGAVDQLLGDAPGARTVQPL